MIVRVKRTVSHGKHPAPRNPSSTDLLLVVQWWSLRNQQRRRGSYLARRLRPSRGDPWCQAPSFSSSDRPVVRLSVHRPSITRSSVSPIGTIGSIPLRLLASPAERPQTLAMLHLFTHRTMAHSLLPRPSRRPPTPLWSSLPALSLISPRTEFTKRKGSCALCS
jgi:hypothetical protein